MPEVEVFEARPRAEIGSQGGGERKILTRGLILALALAYLAGFVLVQANAGLWEAVRSFGVEAVILALWLWVANRLLSDLPVQPGTIKRPLLELGIGLAGLAGLLALTAGAFQGVSWMVWPARTAQYLIALGVLSFLDYDWKDVGIALPPPRVWLALLAVIAINIVASLLFARFLPPGERSGVFDSNLFQALGDPTVILRTLGQILLLSSLPEELFFRVFLLPRLARFMPLNAAVLVQALLFSTAHLPRELFALGNPWPLALATVFLLANGVIGGYFWLKGRSLPVQILLHLFAYSRFGL